MMCTERLGSAHSIGWLTSVSLHVTLAFGALLATQRITLAPQPPPFTWNVAMVTTPSPTTPSSSPSPTTIPPPVNKTWVPAPSPTASAPNPSSAPEAGAVPVEPTRPADSERTSHEDEGSAILTSSSSAERIEQQPAAEQVTSTSEAAAILSLPTRQLSPEAKAFPPSVQPLSRQQEALSPEQTASMAVVAPSVARTDYLWLSETIMRRMEELKRYPAEARLERAEGKVVLKAVIRSDGSIGGIELFQSSGHESLDRAAVELLELAGPLHLPRPLEKSQMTVKIPMSYRLEP